MVTLLGVLGALFVVAAVVARRGGRGGRTASHGAMSEQWLAENRASRRQPAGE
ncbi:MAG TPA: hypothetical protein VMO26_26830 [Vicinamibacterales bacterium]|nr:hypothetical protein [Vicinamibacterales bacterium]